MRSRSPSPSTSRGLHVGHSRKPAGQHDRLVAAVLLPLQPEDAALLVVLRRHVAEVGHHEVHEAVAVEVDGLDVARVPAVGQHAQARRGVPRVPREDQARRHVRGHHLDLPRAVEVEEPGIGHEREGGARGEGNARRQPHGVTQEAPGRSVGGGPGLGSGQLARGAVLVVAGQLLDVEVEGGRGGAWGGADVGHDDAGHGIEHRPPGVTGQHVGCGNHVAARAGPLQHGLGRVGQGARGERPQEDGRERGARQPHRGGCGGSGSLSLPPTDSWPVRSARRARPSFTNAARSLAASSSRPAFA